MSEAKTKRVMMEVDEIVRELECSERHARRLRAAEDIRVFRDVEVWDGPREPYKPDMSQTLQRMMGAVDDAIGEYFYNILWTPEKFSHPPHNMDEIAETMQTILDQARELRERIGLYEGRDGPDGKWCDGLPTFYFRAAMGMPVEICFKKRIEAWAVKYKQRIMCDFFGELEDETDEDETPAEPIVSGGNHQSATIQGPGVG